MTTSSIEQREPGELGVYSFEGGMNVANTWPNLSEDQRAFLRKLVYTDALARMPRATVYADENY